jgi:CheY-like chemotaxis protein
LPDLILLATQIPHRGGHSFLEGFATLHLSPKLPQIVAMMSDALPPLERARIVQDLNISAVCPYPLSRNRLMQVLGAAWARSQPSDAAQGERRLS